MPSDRRLPDSVPRQKTCTYLFLLGFTSMLIYFYSYPLDMENFTRIRQKITNNIKLYRKEVVTASNTYRHGDGGGSASNPSGSTLLQKLFTNESAAVVRSRQLKTTNVVPDRRSSPEVKSADNAAIRSTTISPTESEKNSEQNVRVSTSEDLPPIRSNKTASNRTESREQKDDFKKTAVDETAKMTKEAHSDSATNAYGTDIAEARTSIRSRKMATVGTTDRKVTTETATEEQKIDDKHSVEVSETKEERKITPLQTNKTTLASDTVQQRNFSGATNESGTDDLSRKVSTEVGSTKRLVLPRTSVVTQSVVVDGLNATANTSGALSSVRKGYLVFSEHCRIPDLDPMHPSIAHLIEKNPPLDCSKGHKPLTWTAGHNLFLNQTAILERTAGDSYSCCYRSVFRENDGHSDNDVGFGKECISIFNQTTTIKDEFIRVACDYQNGTEFYEEFHSFIFDKPKVEERCKKVKSSESTKYSVLIIGVDAVSRLNMHRQLNATASYLLNEMEAVEMYGFNKVGDNTFPNLIPMLVGYDERELPSVCWESHDLPLDKCDFLWKRFAAKGYRTLYAEDSPHISSFNYVKKGFHRQPTDYYFRHFMLAYEDALGRDKPLNCYLCVGSTSETEAVLHWTEQFASHFSNRTYFSFSWINSITHDYLNMGSSADHMYERFFRTLHRTGALDKTIVILMGDHGMRWGSIRNTYVGRLEERLPMLMVALPRTFKQEHPRFTEILKQNSHRLVTPFDLHATLVHLLDPRNDWSFENSDNVDEELSKNFTKRALSLFQPVPEDRSCDDAFVEEHWCTCETSLEADIQSEEVRRVAKFLLNRVNALLKPISDKCALLKLASVSDARLWQPPAEHKGHSADDSIYTVVIQTDPGKAVFEGTVKISKPKIEKELLGTISRLNLYGNQSICMDDAILKKYCYCL